MVVEAEFLTYQTGQTNSDGQRLDEEKRIKESTGGDKERQGQLTVKVKLKLIYFLKKSNYDALIYIKKLQIK